MEIWRVERLNPNELFVSFARAHSARFFFDKKRKEKGSLVGYFFLSTRTATMIMSSTMSAETT
jgi:hypothetical protein